MDTCGTHASLVYDVEGEDCQRQNASAHGRVFTTFKWSIFNKLGHESTKNSCETLRLKHSISIDRARDGGFAWGSLEI